MVEIAGPPPVRQPRPRHITLDAGSELVRIYRPEFLGPDEYNRYGPLSRFDHHRKLAAPAVDPDRGIYYAALELADCLVEVFGDTGVIEPEGCRVAVVTLTRESRLLDLTRDGAWLAGSVAALTKDADRTLTQRWSQHFYQDAASYGDIAGLCYENAHNGGTAFALFERAGALRVVEDYDLGHPELQPELAAIAARLGLFIAL